MKKVLTKITKNVNIILVLATRKNVVIIAEKIHLFPFRTQKLSSLALMVLGGKLPGRVGHSHVGYSKVAQRWSNRLLTGRLWVRAPPLEPIWLVGQEVKTPPFHGGNRGSIPLRVTICGIIAQLGEHLPYKQGVTGSSPVGPTICGLVVQLVRMPACHAGGRGFEPLPGRQNKKMLVWLNGRAADL